MTAKFFMGLFLVACAHVAAVHSFDVEQVKTEITSQLAQELRGHAEMQPLLLLVGGYPGAGKTTLINALAEERDLAVVSWDAVRQVLVDRRLRGSPHDWEIISAVSENLLRMCFERRVSVAIDANAYQNNIALIEGILEKEGYQEVYAVVKIALNPPTETLFERVCAREQKEGLYQGTEADLKRVLGSPLKRIDLNDYALIINTEEVSLETELKMVNALIASIEVKMVLGNLIACEKGECLRLLNEAQDAELWNVFLEGQANLFFDAEMHWVKKWPWWHEAERVLEIGSGNGAYLSKLAARFPGKQFQGVEHNAAFVSDANQKFAGERLLFQEGDAEVFDSQREASADVVLFRLTLQHLKDPVAALQNAWHYLSKEGHVFIIEAIDGAQRSSHPIGVIKETVLRVEQRQREGGCGNRRVTLDLLQALEAEGSALGDLYEVAFSNLDAEGEILTEWTRLQGDVERRRSFNHSLLFLTLLHRKFQVPVDINLAYDQLQAYLADESAWSTPGSHLLVLKKILAKNAKYKKV
ncbi:MAG: methyltransferase, partial [Chlamydiota bacterium]